MLHVISDALVVTCCYMSVTFKVNPRLPNRTEGKMSRTLALFCFDGGGTVQWLCFFFGAGGTGATTSYFLLDCSVFWLMDYGLWFWRWKITIRL